MTSKLLRLPSTLLRTASTSSMTLAAEGICRGLGYTGKAVLAVDDILHRDRGKAPVHAHIRIVRGRSRKVRTPVRRKARRLDRASAGA